MNQISASFSLFSFTRWEFVVGRFGFCNLFCRTAPPMLIYDLFATRIRDRPYTCSVLPTLAANTRGQKKNRLLLTIHIANYLEAAPPLRYVPTLRIISLYTPKCGIISPVFVQFFLFFAPHPRPSNESRIDRYAAIVLSYIL